MTFTCAKDHEPIAHDAWDCPACEALEHAAEQELGLQGAENAVRGMEDVADECADADVLQLIAENARLEKELWEARQAVSSLDRAIHRPWEKTLGKRLLAIQKAHKEAAQVLAKASEPAPLEQAAQFSC